MPENCITQPGWAVSRGDIYTIWNLTIRFWLMGCRFSRMRFMPQMGSYPSGYAGVIFSVGKEGCYAEAYHDGYTHCRHVRKILSCRGRGFFIRDELIGGNRIKKSSIQRWHFFQDVSCQKVGDKAVLAEKNGVRVLLLWGGNPELTFWRKEELSPMIVREKRIWQCPWMFLLWQIPSVRQEDWKR